MVVHPSQLVDVPEVLSDEQAVIVEPLACAVHAARQVVAGRVAVIGTGTLGLLTIAALRRLSPATEILATAKHPEQRRWAKELGADATCAPGELARTVRSATGSLVIGAQLTGGAPAVVDCVGSEATLTQALQVVAPGGTVHAVGMPGRTTLDLTSLWHRETSLRGCYAYERADFDTALELVADLDLGRLVTAAYPLSRYEDAVDHAAHAGARGPLGPLQGKACDRRNIERQRVDRDGRRRRPRRPRWQGHAEGEGRQRRSLWRRRKGPADRRRRQGRLRRRRRCGHRQGLREAEVDLEEGAALVLAEDLAHRPARLAD
jgi:hypothetical protein